MILLKYEMKKLLFNKNRLILLAVMFVLYAAIGFVPSLGDESANGQMDSIRSQYMKLVEEHKGKFDPEQLSRSKTAWQAAVAEHGKGEELSGLLSRDPELKFHYQYVNFGQRVDQYWDGPQDQDKANIMGVNPIKEKLRELETSNQTGTYEYRFYKNRLDTELSIGEPIFEDAGIWNNYFIMFDGMLLIFLLLMVLAFFISPLFTQEVRTEMDSIVLCAEKGRREIVTAKLLSAVITTAIITTVYLVGSFTGMLLGIGSFSGYDASARSLEALPWTTLNIPAGDVALLGSLWLILSTAVFGLGLAFISTKTKNHSAAFGLGLLILIAGIMTNSLSNKIKEMIWPIVDFNFGALSMVNEIFGGAKTYNFFGNPVSYGAAAFAACIVLSMAACLFTYIVQRKRAVV